MSFTNLRVYPYNMKYIARRRGTGANLSHWIPDPFQDFGTNRIFAITLFRCAVVILKYTCIKCIALHYCIHLYTPSRLFIHTILYVKYTTQIYVYDCSTGI